MAKINNYGGTLMITSSVKLTKAGTHDWHAMLAA